MTWDLLCRLGLHRREFRQQWIPSIHARIVTEVIFETRCGRCKKLFGRSHLRWDGEEMVKLP